MGVISHNTFKTTDLNNWIHKVQNKQINCYRQKKRNLLVLAVLTNALSKANQELRKKQMERKTRWRQLLVSSSLDIHREAINSDSEICEDINNFMLKLKEIKNPLER